MQTRSHTESPKLRLSDFHPHSPDEIFATIAKLEALRPWFEERGYFLNHHKYAIHEYSSTEFAQYTYPHFPPHYDFEYPPRIELPYSNFGGDPAAVDFFNGQGHPLRSQPVYQIVYAQDSQKRHVAMKLVEERSVEYYVYRRLREERSLYTSNSEEFGCVIPPLDFLELYDGLWFIVMPRWGRRIFSPDLKTIGERLSLMRCLLKGLSVLHKNLIVHRDIKDTNMLISHFSDEVCLQWHNTLRPALRSQNSVVYAFMDFNFSAIFPFDSSPAERRLPAEESFIYPCSRANDTSQGEIDYDPFAFDVGSLGMFFCSHYQRYSFVVPMLAPFFDRMITRDLKNRFTASEALAFLDNYVLPSVPEEILNSLPKPPGPPIFPEPDEYDRWAGLDPEFIKTWSAYRNPPLPLLTKILRWICRFDAGRAGVRAIRKTGRLARDLTRSGGK